MRTAGASAAEMATTAAPKMPSAAAEMSATTPAMPAPTVLRECSLWRTHQCQDSDSSEKELDHVRRA